MSLTCPKCFCEQSDAECERCGVRALDLSDSGDREILVFMLGIKDRTRWTIASIVGGVPGLALGYLGLSVAANYYHQTVVVPRIVMVVPAALFMILFYGVLRAFASKNERRARALSAGEWLAQAQAEQSIEAKRSMVRWLR